MEHQTRRMSRPPLSFGLSKMTCEFVNKNLIDIFVRIDVCDRSGRILQKQNPVRLRFEFGLEVPE